MKYLILLASFVTMASMGTAHAAYTVKAGKLMNVNEVATQSVQDHFSVLSKAYLDKQWEKVVAEATIIIKNFSTTPFAHDALFYQGVAYYHLSNLEMANTQLGAYLKKQTTPKFFEEAIQVKFSIAEQFQKGAKKHLLGFESMPKWVPAREDALAIYEEVITALPNHDLAAQALYGKAKLYFKDEDYKPSIEAYQTLIRRFPKHHLAAESYIGISEVYLTQCQVEFPDTDFLDLAEINLKKFRLDFPKEERLATAEKMLLDMQEIYAKGLYETGAFFERTKKPDAAAIYYTKVTHSFPGTKAAQLSAQRLQELDQKKVK
jgi:outer membrane protein assembly factor BamD (BamD/ComL family)